MQDMYLRRHSNVVKYILVYRSDVMYSDLD